MRFYLSFAIIHGYLFPRNKKTKKNKKKEETLFPKINHSSSLYGGLLGMLLTNSPVMHTLVHSLAHNASIALAICALVDTVQLV